MRIPLSTRQANRQLNLNGKKNLTRQNNKILWSVSEHIAAT